VEKVLWACKKSGIFAITSIIFPCPFENDDTREQTLGFLDKVRPDSVIVTFPIIIPSTAWAADPKSFNFHITDSDYEEKNMDYKIKWLFPPRFWQPLSYTLNGKKFKDFTTETSNFINSLTASGLLSGMSDELVLMAQLSGFENREKEFLSLIRKLFFSGDWKGISELTETINKAIIEQ